MAIERYRYTLIIAIVCFRSKLKVYVDQAISSEIIVRSWANARTYPYILTDTRVHTLENLIQSVKCKISFLNLFQIFRILVSTIYIDLKWYRLLIQRIIRRCRRKSIKINVTINMLYFFRVSVNRLFYFFFYSTGNVLGMCAVLKRELLSCAIITCDLSGLNGIISSTRLQFFFICFSTRLLFIFWQDSPRSREPSVLTMRLCQGRRVVLCFRASPESRWRLGVSLLCNYCRILQKIALPPLTPDVLRSFSRFSVNLQRFFDLVAKHPFALPLRLRRHWWNVCNEKRKIYAHIQIRYVSSEVEPSVKTETMFVV